MTEREPSTQITLREVYDMVVELKILVTTMTSELTAVRDHESRIRGLERAKWLMMGAGAVLGNVGATLIALM